MDFVCKHFDDLSNRELYGIMRLRSEIFVVEQNCVCQDMDGKDIGAYHVFSMESEEVTSCLRVFSPKKGEAVIGRVVTKIHGQGLGGKLLHKGVLTVKKYFPDAKEIRIHAQTYAIGYYAKEGFTVCSEEFLEDGIPHVEMRLTIADSEE
jgi:ElaA protein